MNNGMVGGGMARRADHRVESGRVRAGPKASRRRKRRVKPQRERLLLHYPLFLPGDNKAARHQQFLRSYIQLGQWMLEVREREFKKRVAALRKRESEARRKHSATRSAIEILFDVAKRLDQPGFNADESRQRLLATGLSREELLTLFDQWSAASTQAENTVDSGDTCISHDTEKLRAAARQTRRDLKHLRHENVVSDAVGRLFDAAMKRSDEAAAKALHGAAQFACGLLSFLERQKPELLRPLARISEKWPVLTGLDPADADAAQAKLKRLQLGADTIQGRLRTERAFRESTPARAYARILVETIWTNRLLIPELSEKLRAMQIMDSEATIDFEDIPPWFKLIAGLPLFSTASVPLWAKAAREMLRAESPDFHTRPEWSSVRRAFSPHEKGRVQNKILDKITSAMRTIARGEPGEPVTQSSLPNSGNFLRIRQK